MVYGVVSDCLAVWNVFMPDLPAYVHSNEERAWNAGEVHNS